MIPTKKLRAALATVRKSGGTISVLRALASQGVHESKAGEAIAEGRVMLERGWAPQHRVCHGCGALTVVTEPQSTCECGACDWYEPTELEHVLMGLARAEESGTQQLAALAGDRLRRILKSDDPKMAGAQARLIPFALALTGDPRVSRAVAVAAGGPTPAVGTSWAAQLSQEEIDRLPPHVLDRLRAIADEQRRLDDEARELVALALEPVIDTTARDPRALPKGESQ